MPCLTLDGTPWREGEVCVREVLGRVKAYRIYCTPKALREEGGKPLHLARPPALVGAAPSSSSATPPGAAMAVFRESGPTSQGGPAHEWAPGDQQPRRCAGLEAQELQDGHSARGAGQVGGGPLPQDGASREVGERPLQVYRGHAAAFVGRCLWCLN